MFLHKISYSEFMQNPRFWSLEKFQLEGVNLLVGKNATGKTRTLNVISGFGALLSGTLNVLFEAGTYSATMINGDTQYEYNLELHNQFVKKETLSINGTQYIERNEDGTCLIKAIQLNTHMQIKVPNNQLVAVVRRDEIQHPFLEDLHKWAAGFRHYLFGTALGKDSGISYTDIKNISVNARDSNQVTGMLLKGLNLYGDKFVNGIIGDMRSIGYHIKDIGMAPVTNIPIIGPNGQPLSMIFVQEADRKARTYQGEMSQGMFRVLSLIIQLRYNEFQNASTTILIDDIGEGLDFERSTQMVSLLIKKAEQHNFQLIMTTNDQFIMNSVPLRYWQILQREKSTCYLYNQRNMPKMFEDFEYTGMSNFDLFATNFYQQGNAK